MPKISEHDVDTAYSLRKRGYSWEFISQVLGHSRGALHERALLKYRPDVRADAEAAWERIREAYVAGEPRERLHEILGGSLHALRVAMSMADPASRNSRHVITRHRGNDFTDEAILAAVRACAKDIGETPSGSQYEAWRAADPERLKATPGVATTTHRFETWREACLGAGLVPKERFDGAGRERYWTSERVEAALRDLAEREGGELPPLPRYLSISQGRDDLPSVRTIVMRVGNWGPVRYAINNGLPLSDVRVPKG